MTTTDPNEFLLGAGIPAAKFPTIGTVVVGTITSTKIEQQRDFDTRELKTYDDGNPMMQLLVDLDTDETDPDIEGDDGVRRVYVKGQMLAAVRQVARPYGGLAIGGKLAVKYVSDGQATRRGLNPPKQFKAQYEPPAEKVNPDLIPAGGLDEGAGMNSDEPLF